MWGSTGQESGPAAALCVGVGTRTGTTPRPRRRGRHPASRACRAEMTTDRPAKHLHAVDASGRPSDTRCRRIWGCQPKGVDAGGGLHDLFERVDLGGKNRRLAREHRKRYPARGAAHLSWQSKIMRRRRRLDSTTPRPKIIHLCTGSDEMPGGCQDGLAR